MLMEIKAAAAELVKGTKRPREEDAGEEDAAEAAMAKAAIGFAKVMNVTLRTGNLSRLQASYKAAGDALAAASIFVKSDKPTAAESKKRRDAQGKLDAINANVIEAKGKLVQAEANLLV